MNKHAEINRCLSLLEHNDLTESEIHKLKRRLMQLISLTQHTNEIRTRQQLLLLKQKLVLQLLKIVYGSSAEFCRRINLHLEQSFGIQHDVELSPIRFRLGLAEIVMVIHLFTAQNN